MESDENEVEEGKDLEEQFLMDGPTNPIVDLTNPHRRNTKAPKNIIESPPYEATCTSHSKCGYGRIGSSIARSYSTSSSASMLSQK
jgi:hypothetical protein